MSSLSALPASKSDECGLSSPSKTSEPGDRPFNVYVKSFSSDTDDKKLQEMFKKFGKIQSCTVLRDHAGKSKQVGFVQFSSEVEATSCVSEMHGKEGFGSKPLHVALTSPKPPRTAKKVFGMMVPFGGAMGQPVFAALPVANGQPGMMQSMGQWPNGAGAMPYYVFPSFQPFPGAAPMPMASMAQRSPGHSQGNPPPSTAMYPHAAPGMQPMQPMQPFMVPFADGANGMMVPMRPFRMPTASFAPGFCSPPAPTGYGWGPPIFSAHHTATSVPRPQHQAHIVS